MAKVKMELENDPYIMETTARFNGKEPSANSFLGNYKNRRLQAQIDEVPQKFYDEMNGYNFLLEFIGQKMEYDQLGREAVAEKPEIAVLKIGDKIDKTHFKEYLDEIEKITKRDIPKQQEELIEKALKRNDYTKLSKEDIDSLRKEFMHNKADLIKKWEKMTGETWPRYAEDVLNDAGAVIRREGQPFDVHHIIELSTNGPNEWWNIHPASFPVEHQNGIHALGSWASKIFG